MTKKEFQKKHEFDNDDMNFIEHVCKSTKGSVTSIKDKNENNKG